MPRVVCNRCYKLCDSDIDLVNHMRNEHMIDKETQTHWNHTNDYWFCSDCDVSYDITEKVRLDKHITLQWGQCSKSQLGVVSKEERIFF